MTYTLAKVRKFVTTNIALLLFKIYFDEFGEWNFNVATEKFKEKLQEHMNFCLCICIKPEPHTTNCDPHLMANVLPGCLRRKITMLNLMHGQSSEPEFLGSPST